MGEAGKIEPVVLDWLPRKMTAQERALGLVLVLLAIAVLWYVMRWTGMNATDLVSRLWQGRSKSLQGLLPAVVAVCVALLFAVLKRRSRMHVDAVGIRVRTSIPYLGTYTVNQLAWDSVRSVSYMASLGLLSFRTARGFGFAVRATEWHEADRPKASTTAAEEPDLLRIIKPLGLLDRKSVARTAAEFDLANDGRTRLLLALGAGLGLCALYGAMTQQEAWAFFNLEYVLPHLVAAGVAAVAAMVWLSRRTEAPALPGGIVFGMALVAAMVVGPTSYVAGVRVNQWLGGPLLAQEYYRDSACMNLLPKDPALPVIEYTGLTRAYWCQVPEAQTVQVLVRRGLFGLYQVNLAAQTADIRRFRGDR